MMRSRLSLHSCWLLAIGLLLGCGPESKAPDARNDGGRTPPAAAAADTPDNRRREPPPRPVAPPGRADCPIRLADVTGSTGIPFKHSRGASGRKYILETVVAGLALFDYDGDGLIDVYLLNGTPLKGTAVDAPLRSRLYRNLGNWTFTDVTEKARVGDAGYGLGVTVGDYDNDGLPDIYVSNFGPYVLFHNHGDGTFAEVTARAGLSKGDHVGAGVGFLDADADGYLDLFVANYVEFTYETHHVRKMGPYQFAVGPTDYPHIPSNLFRNHGDGTFADVSAASGIAAHPCPGMGTICFDYDSDGDTDIFVCNDGAPNFLFENDGQGRFKEVGVSAGVAYDPSGSENGNMGVECGDYDNDGRLDLLVTNYQAQTPMLCRNLGSGMFEITSDGAGLGGSTFPHVKWGAGIVDLDNDGNRDLFIACGHLLDNIRDVDDRTDFRVPNILLRNLGNGKFVDVSKTCGDGLAPVESSRGAGFDDLDNDGDVDIVVLNADAPPTIIRNMLYERGSKHHWLQVELRGVKTNRDGVGAGVRVFAGDSPLVDEVHSGRGYQSHYGSRLYFGLGKHDHVDRIEVRWIGGGTDVFTDVRADQRVLLIEGTGQEGR